MNIKPNYRKSFEEKVSVSRETMEKLDLYCELLRKWNPAINLVSSSTLPYLWERHFLDCAQISELMPTDTNTCVDMGSGAGFPGLIVSCLNPEIYVTCIESDQRKSVFLRTVIQELDLNAEVVVGRIEKVPPKKVDVVSARALASVTNLLEYAERHLKKSGTAIFLKGTGHLNETAEARKRWSFDIKTHSSKTDPEAAVLILGDIERE